MRILTQDELGAVSGGEDDFCPLPGGGSGWPGDQIPPPPAQPLVICGEDGNWYPIGGARATEGIDCDRSRCGTAVAVSIVKHGEANPAFLAYLLDMRNCAGLKALSVPGISDHAADLRSEGATQEAYEAKSYRIQTPMATT